MMKTSDPRTDSPNRLWISPFANSERLASPSFTSRHAAISSASGRFERPLNSWRRFFVTSSMPRLPLGGVVFAAGCSVERARLDTRGHVAAGRQRGKRTDDGAVAHECKLTDRLLHDGAFADGAVGQANVRTEARAGSDERVAVQHRAREERDVGRQAHAGVD